jgi:methylenetetrahydrofolate dehydrogenase (NADP+)/methenyltetrahydrofolate cyclohydrolase
MTQNATTIINGKEIADSLLTDIATTVKTLKRAPALAVILVGHDPASEVYVGNKIKACARVGITSTEHKLPDNASADDVTGLITRLNNDSTIDGILLQLPLPKHLNGDALVQTISPAKDVDGLNILNAGKLMAGDKTGFVPCTPQGALRLIKTIEQNLSGMNAVVIGRSLLFGKPMAQLLLAENCTVTMAHSRTRDLPALCRNADIVVAAVGQPEMVRGEWIKQGAIVIDVGINRITASDGKQKLVGDVATIEASVNARAITPVPGGVGPMTIACLMANTLLAYQQSGQ